jgi:RND family efflux transporter MFP subunit
MKKILSIAIVILIAVACGQSDDQEAVKEKIKQYKDEVTQMNLKIKELEQQLAESGNNDKQFVTPIKVNEMKYRVFNHYFQVSGTVDAVDKAYISPEINGQIQEILVNEGEYVQKGQLLARLNTSITENTIEEVKTQLELANTLFKKQQQLWDKNIGSEVQYLQAKNNKESLESRLKTLHAQLDMAYIKSPISGIVDMINIEEGEMAMPGFKIMQVINLSKMKISAEVSEKYLPVISKGDIVSLSFPTFPNINLDVPVYRTGNVINLGNRTFPVELRIDNINNMLKPNILAIMKFLDYSYEEALVVPSIIVKKDLTGEYVYVSREADGVDIAKKVYISTGRSYNDESLVLEGLQEGDKVIIEGYSTVTDGTEVKII